MNILAKIVDAIRILFGSGPLSHAELAVVLDKKAAATLQKLNWRHSVVDLMKLAGMDSSLSARAKLAAELGHKRPFTGTAEQNIWLHGQVMQHLSRSLEGN